MSSGSKSKRIQTKKRVWGNTVGALLPYALIFLPFFLSLLYVRAFGVNVVVRDQWEVAALFGQLSPGNLSLADLWEPHNEHRFFFPRIVMLALGTITEWNTVAEMYFIQACLLVTLTALFFAFRSTTGAKTLLFVPVAFLVFSLRQRANLLWGYQITFAMTQAFSVLALFLLHVSHNGHRARFTFLAALLCAAVATGSSIQGLLVWPAGLVQLLLLSGRDRPKRRVLTLWCLTGLAGWILYFLGYERRGESPGTPASLLEDPISAAEYFLTLLGNSLLSQQRLVLLAGLMLLGLTGLAIHLIRKTGRLEEYAFWISVMAFSLFSLLAITVGRIGLDTQSALASRYTTFSLLAVVSLYAMFVKLLAEHRSLVTTATFGFLLGTIALSVAVSYKNAIPLGIQERTINEKAAAVLRDYEDRPDGQLEILHRRPEVVRRHAPILERLDYNVFATDQKRP